MELIYTWIKDFKPFKDFPVNCSNKYNFEYDEVSKILSVDLNSNPLPDDFFGKNIINVNPILGNNGAGKTRFFSFLTSYFGNYNIEFIIVLKVKKELRIFHHKNVSLTLSIRNIESANPHLENEILKIKPEIVTQDNNLLYNLIDKGLSKIYVNHNIQLNQLFPSKNLYDRSTSAILYDKSNKKISRNEYAAFVEDEMRRNLALIRNRGDLVSKIFDFKSKSVGIYFDNSLSYNNRRSQQYTRFLSQNLAIRDAITQSKGRKRLSENYFVFENTELKAVFFGLAILQFLGKDIDTISLKSKSLIEINKDIGRSISDLQVSAKSNSFKLFWNLVKSRKHSKNIQLQINLGPDSNVSFPILDFVSIQFEVSFESAPEFISLYFAALELSPTVSHVQLDVNINPHFLGFNWHISTGQFAYLSLFSRILMQKSTVTKSPTIWIILDEVDQVFHPQWEKEFLTIFLEFVKLEFPKNKIQLFIGSHNPIILSDIPHTNATLVKVDGSLPPINVSKINQTNTFGGNIHSLYKNSFFLNDGFIGSFAQSKIDEIVVFLNKAINSKTNFTSPIITSEYAFNVINIIGEPIVKQMLLEMYYKVFENKNMLNELQRKKEEIEQKIKELKKV